jgi:hypothetical protein
VDCRRDKYKVLSRVFAQSGEKGIRQLLEEAQKEQLEAYRRMGLIINPQ